MKDVCFKENNLLVDCCKVNLTSVDITNIKRKIQDIDDFNNLYILAKHHKLLPLLYTHLKKLSLLKCNLHFSAKLENYFVRNAFRNLLLYGNLKKINDEFRRNNIKYLPFKGPLFTILYYNNLSLRSFCDIDILVDYNDIPKCISTLKSIGFDLYPYGISEKYFYRFLKNHFHGQLINNDNVIVEVHWLLSNNTRIKLDWNFVHKYSSAAEVDCNQLYCIDPELLTVYLALHGQRHSWQKYDYLVSLSEVINKMNISNWSRIYHLSKQLGIQTIVFNSCIIANKILRSNLDIKILEDIFELNSTHSNYEKHYIVYNKIHNNLITKTKHNKFQTKRIYPFSLHLKYGILYTLQRYYRFYFKPSTDDWVETKLPYSLNSLYYLIKPVRKALLALRELLNNVYTKKSDEQK